MCLLLFPNIIIDDILWSLKGSCNSTQVTEVEKENRTPIPFSKMSLGCIWFLLSAAQKDRWSYCDVDDISLDPRGRPTVTAGNDHHYFRTRCPSIRLSVYTFQNITKQNNFQVRINKWSLLVGLWVWPSGSCWWYPSFIDFSSKPPSVFAHSP